MAVLKINDEHYDIDDLSDDAKAQISHIQFVENEIKRLEMRLAALKTARNGYTRALANVIKQSYPEDGDVVELPDTLTFD